MRFRDQFWEDFGDWGIPPDGLSDRTFSELLSLFFTRALWLCIVGALFALPVAMGYLAASVLEQLSLPQVVLIALSSAAFVLFWDLFVLPRKGSYSFGRAYHRKDTAEWTALALFLLAVVVGYLTPSVDEQLSLPRVVLIALTSAALLYLYILWRKDSYSFGRAYQGKVTTEWTALAYKEQSLSNAKAACHELISEAFSEKGRIGSSNITKLSKALSEVRIVLLVNGQRHEEFDRLWELQYKLEESLALAISSEAEGEENLRPLKESLSELAAFLDHLSEAVGSFHGT